MAEKKTELGSSFSIERVGIDKLGDVWGIIDTCSKWLDSQGFDHWKRYYTERRVHRKLQTQEVYLLSDKEQVLGTITLDTNKIAYHTRDDMASFADPEAKALYVTALATLPDKQGQGVGSKLMEFAESQAEERKIKYIRLDCRADLTDVVKFYTKRGYNEVGSFLDESHNNDKYLLMEKKIV